LGNHFFSTEGKEAEVKLTSHLNPPSRFRMSGVIPPKPSMLELSAYGKFYHLFGPYWL
jgi:hypothetical protein